MNVCVLGMGKIGHGTAAAHKSTGQQLPKSQKRLIILAGSLPFPKEADGQRESATAKEYHQA